MNQFNGIGNLTKDPELRKTQSNLSVCSFTIAINEGYGDKKTTDYIDCVAWRNLAENLAQYQRKGNKIAVTGKLKKETWKDQKTGDTRSRTYVLTDSIEYLDRKQEAETTEPEIPQHYKGGFDPDKSPDLDISSEELPFY